ncbi:family 1 glycosylhydrolase, partial [Candidatus Kaiserbacteria bacterium]|nr:family 1 glycosylhydrolase [Candidatus Kaiserbacteria bacterium]
MKFPKDFYFGAATAAHQVEGGNVNDWSEWERKTAKIKAQEAALRPFALRQAQG